MSNWAELGRDLLFEIARRIHENEDFVAFGGVCTSWRSVAVRQNFRGGSLKTPLLMLGPNKSCSKYRPFYNLLSDTTCEIPLPEAYGKKCFSSNGWIITIDIYLNINLLHPFDRHQIKLPKVKTFEKNCDGTKLVYKAVLSSNPYWTSDYTFMVIYGEYHKLAFCCSVDESWTLIGHHKSAYFDVIYYKGKFYAVDCGGRVRCCDVGGTNPIVAQDVVMLSRESFKDCCIDKLYLVESAGALLVILRQRIEGWGLKGGSGSKLIYGTYTFRVLEVDVTKGEYIEVKSLGNRALFLGFNSSMSMEASDSNGCRDNCVYFTDGCYGPEGGNVMGIYNMLDGSIEPVYNYSGPDFRANSFSPPMWITPSY